MSLTSRRNTIKKTFAKMVSLFKGRKKPAALQAEIIPRSEHPISRQLISDNALKVLYRLKKAGYQAYLVGGCVRDLLLERRPKDFDVATNASPNEIKRCFRNSHLIGRRFRLVHVNFKDEIIEVSTFRASHDAEQHMDTHTETGMILRDNVYGTLDEDANRRDFTVNALYYNITDFSVLDFHQGLKDLRQGILRMIGDPMVRYREDPVRILRAVRLAAKLGFRIEAETEKPIFIYGHLLTTVSPHRLFTEILKLFLSETASEAYALLKQYRLFVYLFPGTDRCLQHTDTDLHTDLLLSHAFQDTDDRLKQGKTVSPGYLAAVLLWHPLQYKLRESMAKHSDLANAFDIAWHEVVQEQQKHISVPRHFLITARSIWELQYRMEKRKPAKCHEILAHPRFRAAYDFLQLRMRSGENLEALFQWWTTFYEGDAKTRDDLLSQIRQKRKRRRK